MSRFRAVFVVYGGEVSEGEGSTRLEARMEAYEAADTMSRATLEACPDECQFIVYEGDAV